MAAANQTQAPRRQTGYDSEAEWNSTYKPLWEKCMPHIGNFDNIGIDDLVGDNSIIIMTTFAKNLANAEDSRHTKRPYSTTTLTNALNACIHRLKVKFRNESQNLPNFFPDDHVKKWRAIVKDGRNRNAMQGDKESDLFRNTFPIPRQPSLRTVLFFEDEIRDPALKTAAEKINLKDLSSHLFGRERFLELSKIVHTYRAIGRSGEVKFLSYDRMMYDNRFNMVFTQWFQRKTLKSTPIAFVPNYDHPESCSFLTLGCLWACDNGLLRPDGIGERGSSLDRKTSFVFQDLHNMRDDSVASQLSNIIKQFCPDQLKKLFSAKGMRYGAITELMWDPAITYEESVALGGWSTASNSDWYTWTYVVAVIPPALLLAGYPDPRVLPHVPHCGPLFGPGPVELSFPPEKFSGFINALFPNDLRHFQPPHGRLRDLLIKVAAVMIMHFDNLYRKYGITHKYCRKMVDSVMHADLAAVTHEAVTKLRHWSKAILDDFKKGNTVVPHRANAMGLQFERNGNDQNTVADNVRLNVLKRQGLQDQVAKVSANVSNMLQSTNVLQQFVVEQRSVNVANNGEIQKMMTQQQTLTEQIRLLVEQQNQMINFLKSHRIEANAAAAMDLDLPHTPANNQDAQLDNSNQVTPPNNPPAIPPQPVPLNQALMHAPPLVGHRGKQDPAKTLTGMLYRMHTDPTQRCFNSLKTGGKNLDEQAAWVNSELFKSRKDCRRKIQLSLQLLDAIWTKEERDKIINKKLGSDNDHIRLHKDVCNRAKEIVFVLKKTNKKKTKASNQMKDAILGLANHITQGLDINGKFTDYVPDWNDDGKRKSAMTLHQLMVAKVERIKRIIPNPYL